MTLATRLADVTDRAANAAALSGRVRADLTIIPVTKFHPGSLIRELHSLGVRDFAENRHQEAREKAAELADLPDLRWHFIGQLQGKKARQAQQYAHMIHSVDRESLIAALESDTVQTNIFLQVNLTEDPARGGMQPGDVSRLADLALATTGIRLFGIMAVAPLGVEPRRAFARVRDLSEKLRQNAPRATAISAGMSADFEAAIEEGATHLRIGTAITGNRPQAG